MSSRIPQEEQEMRKSFIRSLSIAQVHDVDVQGEAVIEREADELMAVFKAQAAKTEDRLTYDAVKEVCEGCICLLKSLTPARPEDLTMSQWHGLVEAIKAGTETFEEELEQLHNQKKEAGE